MALFAVRWTDEALDDVARIVDYISSHNPNAAARIGQALLELGDSLEWAPWRGKGVPARDSRVRALRHHRYRAYSLQYLIDGGIVVIEHAWHAAQQERDDA